MSAGESSPKPEQPWLSRRRFWTLFAVGIGLMVLIAAAGVYYDYVTDEPLVIPRETTSINEPTTANDDVPLVISRETTYITEPLTVDGTRVDYWAAAELLTYPPEMGTEDNGYRMVVQELRPSAANSSDEVRQISEKLGLDPNIAPRLTYEDPFDVLTRIAEAEAPLTASAFEQDLKWRIVQPWTLDDLPGMRTWLERDGQALDLIAEAVRQPKFVPPWTRFDEDRLQAACLNEVQRLRDFAYGYQVRARFRLAAGDIDGAIDDIVACARMGRHLRDGGFLIEDLVGIATEAMAFSVGAGESLTAQPSEEEWRRLLSELNHLPSREHVVDPITFEMDRLGILDTLQSISRGESIAWGEEGQLWPPNLTRLFDERAFALDWNIVFRQFNEHFDKAIAGTPIPQPRLGTPAILMPLTERSRVIGDVVSYMMCPAIEQYKEACRRSVCKENLLRIAIAMLLYEKEHGTLPPAYSVDEQGKPQHSWRVLILPYLGYDELYSQIRIDEPWNSVHNSEFLMADVPIYQCPSGVHSAGQTIYTVIVGETTAFQGGVGKRLDTFGPNSANLILVAERIDPVCWMDPAQEVPFAIAERGINVDGATTGLGSEHEGGLHTALRSGSVSFFSQNIPSEQLRGLLEGTIERAP